MKNRLTTMTLAIILFTAFLMSLSCKDTSQNNAKSNNAASNTAANINQNNSVQNSDLVPPPDVDCSGTNVEKIEKVNMEIRKNIASDTDLSKQFINEKFKFNPVADGSGKLVLYIWGRVITKVKDNGGGNLEANVDDLNKTFKKLVKKGCVAKVVFGQPSSGPTITLPGFEYNLCESPNGVCSDGVCRPGCLLLKPEDNINTNTNTNTNANANR